MWTHLQPYLEDDGTARYVSRLAQMALWRAINHGQMIAFAGSGVSIPHGFPDWRGLTYYFLEATRKEYDAIDGEPWDGPRPRRPSREVRRLVEQLNFLLGAKKQSELGDIDIPTFEEVHSLPDHALILDLCEEILKRLPTAPDGTSRLRRARETLAAQFRRGAVGLSLDRLLLLEPTLKVSVLVKQQARATRRADKVFHDGFIETLARLFRDQDPNVSLSKFAQRTLRDLPLYDEESGDPKDSVSISMVARAPDQLVLVEDNYPRPVDASGTQENVGEKPAIHDRGRDPIDAIFENIRLSRVLTTNYDVQFERWIATALRVKNDLDRTGFQDLCRVVGELRDQPPRRIVETGVRRGALSATMIRDNVGELINFGSYHATYDYQVFHLHGRVDDPANMVLTQEDYRSIYLQESYSRQAFEAAQEVVFGGNDVLFLGMGMKEEDLLVPFKRFVARQNAHDVPAKGQGRAFVLLPSAYSEDGEDIGAYRRRNQATQLRLYLQFRILPVFYGGPVFRKTIKALDKISETIAGKYISLIDIWFNVYEPYTFLTSEYDQRVSCSGPLGLLLFKNEYDLLVRAMQRIEAWVKANEKIPSMHLRAARALVGELKSRVMSRALVEELKHQSEGARQYWVEWNRSPDERRAYYGVPIQRAQGEQGYLWVRHYPDYAVLRPQSDRVRGAEGAGVYWSQLKYAQSVAAGWDAPLRRKTLREAKMAGLRPPVRFRYPRRRIVRFTASRGGGKGAFVNLFLHKQQQLQLFPAHPDSRLPLDYQGAFVAHLVFSLEFYSVIPALTRFFAGHVARLQACGYQTSLEVGGCRVDAVKVEDGLRAVDELFYMKPDDGDAPAKRTPHNAFLPGTRSWHVWRLVTHVKPELAKIYPANGGARHLSDEEFNEQYEDIRKKVYAALRQDDPTLCLRPELLWDDDLADLEDRERITPRYHKLEGNRPVQAAFPQRVFCVG